MWLDYDRGELLVVAPDCFYYELANLVRTAERRGRITSERADAVFGAISRLPLPTMAAQELVADAAILSRGQAISVYDAFYLALAERTGSTFITADDKLLATIGYLPYVRSLSGS